MRGLGRRAKEYRSQQAWGGLPLVHIAVGGRGPDGRYHLGRARGVVAMGDVATGLIACGGVAIGLLSLGGVAVGLLAVGGLAIGLAAVGAVSVGLFAAGAVALGLTAWGAVTQALALPGRLRSLRSSFREVVRPRQPSDERDTGSATAR